MVFVILIAGIVSGLVAGVCVHALGGSLVQVVISYPLGGVSGILLLAVLGAAWHERTAPVQGRRIAG